MCTVPNASGIARYRTAGVRIVKIYVQFLVLLVFYLLNPDFSFNFKSQLWQSDPYRFVIRMLKYPSFSREAEFLILTEIKQYFAHKKKNTGLNPSLFCVIQPYFAHLMYR
jgi:hypothetical protein